MELKSKVAVVTGGAVRIGQAITLALAREGCGILNAVGGDEACQPRTGSPKLGQSATERTPRYARRLVLPEPTRL